MLSTVGALYTKESEDQPGHLVNASTDDLAVTWGTGWEVLDLEFFTSPRVLEFTHKVERSLGHYRHNWGDHLVRAYQVQLFAPLDRVRCFDGEEMPGQHGCSAYERDTGGEFVFHFMEDLACPSLWTSEGLRGVPWSPQNYSPRQCLEVCNELQCEGFDVIFHADQTADCLMRNGRATTDIASAAAWKVLRGTRSGSSGSIVEI